MQDRYKAVRLTRALTMCSHGVRADAQHGRRGQGSKLSAKVVQVVIVALVAEAVPLKQWSEYGMCHAAVLCKVNIFWGL
jgi:hypothetical protein